MTCPLCTLQVPDKLMNTIDINKFVIDRITEANYDRYYCLQCLTYLGNDMFDGNMCHGCNSWYCEECANRLKLPKNISNCPGCPKSP